MSILACSSNGSSSTISADAVTGWHVLKVEGYSQIKGLGVGKRIKSSPFRVGDHTWRLSVFPDGHDERNADWICVDLLLDHPAANGDVRVRFKFTLLDLFGEAVPSYTLSTVHTFNDQAKSWGFFQFIKRKDLESSYLKEDSFRIRCDVTVIKEIRTKDITMESDIMVPPPDLHRHLGVLLESKVGGDVTFEVDGEVVMAHRYMLAARSSVFMAELFGSMKERLLDDDPIHIDDMEARVFKIMLHFIYTDSLPEVEGADKIMMAQHLLAAADRYNLHRLKLIWRT